MCYRRHSCLRRLRGPSRPRLSYAPVGSAPSPPAVMPPSFLSSAVSAAALCVRCSPGYASQFPVSPSPVSLLPDAACCDIPLEPHARVPAVTNRHHSRIPVHKQAHPPVTQHHIGVTTRPFQHSTSPVHTQHGRIRQAGCPACSTRRDALCLSSRHQICDQRTRNPRRGFGAVLRAVHAPLPLLLP
jgi:hypothetical protein